MYINENAEFKQLEIWVGYSEKDIYKSEDKYKRTIDKYKDLGYKISVFIGGSAPLLPVITSLLETQYEKNLDNR